MDHIEILIHSILHPIGHRKLFVLPPLVLRISHILQPAAKVWPFATLRFSCTLQSVKKRRNEPHIHVSAGSKVATFQLSKVSTHRAAETKVQSFLPQSVLMIDYVSETPCHCHTTRIYTRYYAPFPRNTMIVYRDFMIGEAYVNLFGQLRSSTTRSF